MIFLILFCAAVGFSQSTDQNFPTPVTQNSIESTISARDIGDSRLTNYFYTFDGDQGDLFINIVTNNLTGDIDLFTMDGLRPMTKVSVYGDLSESETGRVVYLRKREKLLLRIQGRTPNDEPATFRIKFAGSFIAAVGDETTTQPKLPTVRADNSTGIVVNSVGTVIERRQTAAAKELKPVEIAKKDQSAADTEVTKTEPNTVESKVAVNKETEKVKLTTSKTEVVVTDKVEKEISEKRPKPAKTAKNTRRKGTEVKKPPAISDENTVKETEKAQEPEKSTVKSLGSIKLIVLFKDGTKIERPMDEVLRFTVDNGVLTIISKDGRIGRYSIFDIEKTTIE